MFFHPSLVHWACDLHLLMCSDNLQSSFPPAKQHVPKCPILAIADMTCKVPFVISKFHFLDKQDHLIFKCYGDSLHVHLGYVPSNTY